MEWGDVRYFLALARTGSIRAAGTALGVSHSTVARRVEALEEQLETRLFDRHRDGYAVTDAGARMVPSAERVENEMAALERTLQGTDGKLAGSIALTCCDNFVGTLLIESLAPFLDEHSSIELTFTTDSRPFDLAKREADIAIRTLPRGVDPPDFLIGRKLAPVTVANYVATVHRDRLDPTTSESSRWLSFEDRAIGQAVVDGTSFPSLPLWGAFSSLELLAHATAAGLGLAVMPTYVGDRVAALERLEPADVRHLADLWLVSHPDLRENARFRAMRQFIGDVFERHRLLFGGDCPRREDGPLD